VTEVRRIASVWIVAVTSVIVTAILIELSPWGNTSLGLTIIEITVTWLVNLFFIG